MESLLPFFLGFIFGILMPSWTCYIIYRRNKLLRKQLRYLLNKDQ